MARILMQGYRSSTNQNEIGRILNVSRSETDNMLWQNVNGKRYVYSISHYEVMQRLGSMMIYIEGSVASINSREWVYIKLSHRGTVFKTQVINLVNGVLTIRVPAEIKTLEMRAIPRTKFRPKDEKKATFLLTSDLLSVAKQSLSYKVIDISEKGMSIVSSTKNLDILQNSGSLILKKLDDLNLPIPVNCYFVYSQIFRYKFKGKIVSAHRIGIKFETKLDEIALEAFSL